MIVPEGVGMKSTRILYGMEHFSYDTENAEARSQPPPFTRKEEGG